MCYFNATCREKFIGLMLHVYNSDPGCFKDNMHSNKMSTPCSAFKTFFEVVHISVQWNHKLLFYDCHKYMCTHLIRVLTVQQNNDINQHLIWPACAFVDEKNGDLKLEMCKYYYEEETYVLLFFF